MITYRDIQKVLPLVYDDTLSYYEVLCKVRDKMNEIVDLDNAQSEAITELSSSIGERYNQFEQKILNDLSEMKTELEGEIREGDEDVTETLTALINALGDRVTSVEETVDDMEATVNAVTSMVTDLDSSVDQLSSDVATQGTNITALNNRVIGVESSVTNLGTRVDNIDDSITDINSALETGNERLDDIEEDLSHLVFADVDSAMSSTSTNPVENRAITEAINNLDLTDLHDVNMSNIRNGQIPVYELSSGKWKNQNIPLSGLSILNYGVSTFEDCMDAYNNNALVYCKASASSTDPSNGYQGRMAFLAYVGTAGGVVNEFEFQYYRSQQPHTTANFCDQVYIYKMNRTDGWSFSIRYVTARPEAGTGISLTDGGTTRIVIGVDCGLEQLNNTTISNPADNQVVTYQNGEYVNGKKLPFDLGVESGAYGYYDSNNTFHSFKSQADIDTAVADAMQGDAVASNVLSGKTFTNETTSGVVGTMPNKGSVKGSIYPSERRMISEGYHDGTGYIEGKENFETYTARTRSDSIDLGISNLYRYVKTTSVPNANDGTFTPTTRSASIDMGETNTYRYINTNSVPNSLSETVLWTNPSPSTNFNSQTITLSQNISAFAFLQFVYMPCVGQTSITKSIIIGAAELSIGIVTIPTSSQYLQGSMWLPYYSMLLQVMNSSGTSTKSYSRMFDRADTNKIYFEECLSEKGTVLNNLVIPYKVIGLK